MLAMRSVAFLLMLAGAGAQEVAPSCMIDSSKAVNEMLDSALYIWTAIERCGKSGKDEIQCSVDVESVIQSISKMVKLILNSIDECTILKTSSHTCEADILDLTQAAAGLAEFSTKVYLKCPAHEAPAPAPAPVPAPTPTTSTCAGFVCAAPMTLRPQPERLECVGACTADTCCLAPIAPAAPVPSDPCAPGARKLSGLCGTQQSRRLGLSKTHFRAATCAIEVKDTMRSVAKAVVKIMNVQKHCGKGYMKFREEVTGKGYSWSCNNNAMDLVGAFADMATFILGAVSHCERIQLEVGIACAGAVSGLISKLLDVSTASDGIAQHCVPDEATTEQPTILVPTPVPTPVTEQPTVLVPTPVPTPVTAQPTILVPTPVPTPVTAQPTILVPTPVPTPVPAPRLYAKDGASAGAPKENGTMTLTLVALMPVTAIASFFVGSRFARLRSSSPYESAAREIE